MKKLLFLLLLFSSSAFGKNYYLTTGQSISYVNGLVIKSPDSIFFQRGMIYSGTLNAVSGVYYGTYGNGASPVLTSTGGLIVSLYKVTGVTIDGFTITDPSMPVSDHTAQARIGYAISLDQSSNCTLKNLDVSLVGVGIEVHGDFNTITNSKFGNLRMVRNTVGGDDDYGANPMVISGNDNTISFNSFKDCWATSYDYGYDGGAVELFGGYSRNKVLFNTAINCNGFMEIGSSNGGTASDNLIAYNLLINNGLLTWANVGGSYSVTVSGLQYSNNFIVETSNTFSQAYLFDYGGTPSNYNILSLTNNIFYLSTGIDVIKSGKFPGSLLFRNGNIYKLFNGSVTNFTLDPSELITSDAVFKSTVGDPSTWDYTLSPLATGRGIVNIVNVSPDVPPITPPVIVPPDTAAPAKPGAITGSTRVCPVITYGYSVDAVQGVTYLWSSNTVNITLVPTTSNSVTAYVNKYFTGGEISVVAKAGSKTSDATTITVKKKRYCR